MYFCNTCKHYREGNRYGVSGHNGPSLCSFFKNPVDGESLLRCEEARFNEGFCGAKGNFHTDRVLSTEENFDVVGRKEEFYGYSGYQFDNYKFDLVSGIGIPFGCNEPPLPPL